MQVKSDISSKLFKYFRRKKILINKDKFAYTLKSHPKYPQLISIVDTLAFFSIEYDVYETSSIQEIEESVICFIALLKRTNNLTELSFVERNNNLYKIDSINVSLDVVNKYWGNIVLILGENEKFKDKKNKKIIVSFLASAFILLAICDFKFSVFGFYIFPILGMLLSIITLKDIFGFNSSISEKICKASKKTDCQAILSSKKWKLFKLIDFSDLSLSFFLSQFFLLFITSLFNAEHDFFQLQFIALLTSTPLILISLYYQKNVEKKWCILCLGIIIVLTLEFIFLLIFRKELSFPIKIQNDIILLNIVIFGCIFILWKTLKKLILKYKELLNKDLRRNHTLFSYPIFKAILKRGKPYNIEFNFLKFNRFSKFQTFLLITDPFCNHCKNLHSELHSLSIQIQDSINWGIIFNVYSRFQRI
jgi:uncharacterized membrane protein